MIHNKDSQPAATIGRPGSGLLANAADRLISTLAWRLKNKKKETHDLGGRRQPQPRGQRALATAAKRANAARVLW